VHWKQVCLEQSSRNICARNNNARIRYAREASVLQSAVNTNARNNNAGIRCVREASVLVSGVPGTYVQGITVRG
jgi:hypothetical protein